MVTDVVLTMEGLRLRRAEILGIMRKHRAHRIAVFGSVARGEARPASDLDLLGGSRQAPPFLITSAWFRILRNSWASQSRSSRGAPSRPGTTKFAPRPWICDQTPERQACSYLDHAKIRAQIGPSMIAAFHTCPGQPP